MEISVPDHSFARNPHPAAPETRERRKPDRNLPDEGEQEQQIQINFLPGFRLLRA